MDKNYHKMTFIFKNKNVFIRMVEAINETYYMVWFDETNNSLTVTHPKAIEQIREYCRKRHIAVTEVE